MTLRIVSSGDGPAIAIRDHLLPRVREHGRLELQRDSVRLIVLQDGAWRIEHWTPFNELERGEAASPGYRHALAQQHSVPDLPYGLDVWHAEDRVMRVLWSDNGAYELVEFARGAWEAEALAL